MLIMYIRVHPTHPQLRLIRHAVAVLKDSGIIVYPTVSGYALGCQLGDKTPVERIRQLRNLDKHHNFTLICKDLSEISTYAHIDNPTFRLLRSHTPGPYTFILKATREVPKRLQHPKRKSIGIRVSENEISRLLLEELGAPIMSVTLQMPDEEFPMVDPNEIREQLTSQVDLIIDAGFCGMEPTSIIDFTSGSPVIIREGQGDTSGFI